ncbi:MAG TPA: HAMP domain-containing sensor histidine kinase [Gemmatimonadales bacterium]|nr:HAMP domain-containing sensor histidine kinase [Gemmatimonadales bacterium]
MHHPVFLRLIQRPGLLGATLFVVTMGLAAALAYQAVGAATAQRTAAEATLAHHATIAAWRFAREGRSWLDFGMAQAGDLLFKEIVRRETLPDADVLQQLLADEDCDCMSAGFARTVFRVLTDPEPMFTSFGEQLPDGARIGLINVALQAAADTQPLPGARPWQMLPPGEPSLARATDVVLLWKIGDWNRSGRKILGIYGMVVEPAQIVRSLEGALVDAQFFPSSLIPARSADSLVRIEVAGPNGVPLFETGPERSAFIGTDTLGLTFGSLLVTAAIAPDADRLLIVGGLPTSRLPTVVALMLLTMGVGGAALLLLRREHRLARLREDFVSSVSHELRTPLTQIRMLSELLQTNGFRTEAERVRATGVIHRETFRLTSLVDNILEFGRLRRPATIQPPARVPLGELAREITESFAPLLDAQGSRLARVIADDLEVAGGRDSIGRVLRNLIENALKYGPQGQTVRLTISRSGTAARVVIDDQGPGIPREARTRIWEPYYRLDRDHGAPVGGSGLGLAVVAGLMSQLGGQVWVEEAPGGGARMIVEFPDAAERQEHG